MGPMLLHTVSYRLYGMYIGMCFRFVVSSVEAAGGKRTSSSSSSSSSSPRVCGACWWVSRARREAPARS